MQTIEEITEYHRNHRFVLPKSGQTIIGPQTGTRYLIGDQFDAGGYGHIYFCTDEWGHELVAKVLMPLGDQQEMQQRAEAEFVAASIARSPYIVQVAEAFVCHGAYYIISERCSFSLRRMFEDPGFNLPVWFQPLARALLHALHFMHTRELTHGDVHAGNILLHRKPDILVPNEQSATEFKLGDSGQARSIAEARAQDSWHPGCIPPEVLDANEYGPVDYRADIYQAGLLLLNLLAGSELEFDQDDILAGRPRALAETLPHPAANAIASMLRRHAQFRIPSALDAWRAIDASLNASLFNSQPVAIQTNRRRKRSRKAATS